MRKIKEGEEAESLARATKSQAIDIDAANRFIAHSLPDLSKEQREALGKGGKKVSAPGVGNSGRLWARVARR